MTRGPAAGWSSSHSRAPASATNSNSAVARMARLFSVRFDFDATPEGNPAPDLLRRRGWTRVVPGAVRVHAVTDDDVVIDRDSVPGAGRMAIAAPQVFSSQVREPEVGFAINDYGIGAIRKNRVVPDGPIALGHDRSSGVTPSTLTPCQKATRPLMLTAAGLGSG